VPVNLPPRHVLGGELSTHLEVVEGLLDLNGGLWGAACVLGPDLDTDLFRALVGMELRPLRGVTLGGRVRALVRPSFRASAAVHEALELDDTWVGAAPPRSDLADGIFGTVDLYGRYRTPGGAFTIGFALQNALDGDEPVPSVAVLDLAPPLSLPAPGRTFFFTLEGEM
jgi:outer membrane receptor protein involved in Fe transport